MSSVPQVRARRVYEEPSAQDGARVLVDRVWPRGLRKDALQLDDWARDVAPSTELRTWYGHDPARWPEFKRRYRAELRTSERRELLETLADQARRGTLTLVFAARDEERNSARVVREELAKMGL